VGFSLLNDELLELFFVLVGEGANSFATLFGADVDLVAADFAEVVVVDICQKIDVLGPVVPFFQSSGRIQFKHVVGRFPVQVHLGVVIDRFDDGHLKPILAALLKLRKGHVEGRERLCNAAVVAEFPEIEQLVFALLIGGEDGQVVVFGLNVLDHGGNFGTSSFHFLEGCQRHHCEFVHSEYSDKLVIDGSHFGAKHVFLADDVERGLEAEVFEVVEEELCALNVEKVGSED
jgi:hypothetical protein